MKNPAMTFSVVLSPCERPYSVGCYLNGIETSRISSAKYLIFSLCSEIGLNSDAFFPHIVLNFVPLQDCVICSI